MKTKRKKNRLILVSKLSIVTIFLSLFLLMLYPNFDTIDVKTFDISRNRTLRSNNLLMVYDNKENILLSVIFTSKQTEDEDTGDLSLKELIILDKLEKSSSSAFSSILYFLL